jgi:hypothetical protein
VCGRDDGLFGGGWEVGLSSLISAAWRELTKCWLWGLVLHELPALETYLVACMHGLSQRLKLLTCRLCFSWSPNSSPPAVCLDRAPGMTDIIQETDLINLLHLLTVSGHTSRSPGDQFPPSMRVRR